MLCGNRDLNEIPNNHKQGRYSFGRKKNNPKPEKNNNIYAEWKRY